MVMKVILLVKDTEVIVNKEKTDDVETVEKMALGKRKMLKLVYKPTSSS